MRKAGAADEKELQGRTCLFVPQLSILHTLPDLMCLQTSLNPVVLPLLILCEFTLFLSYPFAAAEFIICYTVNFLISFSEELPCGVR